MDANRFDAITRFFASRRLSRRSAFKGAGAGLAAGVLGSDAVAQDATPPGDVATPVTTDVVAKTPFLFVQSFQSGSITPKDGVDDRYTLTLEAGLGQTLYFSDRPERIVGVTPTPQFLEGLGFTPDNPPNAALVVETGAGETDIAVVELFTPVYDEATHTATYEVAVLANWETSTELGFTEAPTDLATVAPSFGAAHLFIDDCADDIYVCMAENDGNPKRVGETRERYWNCWSGNRCEPCKGNPFQIDEATQECNALYPTQCNGNCFPTGHY